MAADEIPEFPLPDFLTLTPERIEENEANQRLWRENAGASFPGAVLDPRSRAVRILDDSVQVMNLLAEQMHEISPEKLLEISAAISRERERYAEALATLGRYDEAAAADPNRRRAETYIKIWDAVWRDDKETCKCPTYRQLGEHKVLSDTHALDVYSLKTGSMQALVKCGICSFMNVRPLTQELAEQRRNQQWHKK